MPAEIAAFEQHYDLELFVNDPVLHLDQFSLKAQQLLEIETPLDRFVLGMIGHVVHDVRDLLVIDLQLHLLVEIVDDFAVDTPVKGAFGFLIFRGHGGASLFG